MLTVLHITNRGLYPLRDLQLGQYDLLAQSLLAQRDDAGQPFLDYELLVVDRENPLPRPELEHACRHTTGGVRFLRPRATPWTRLGAFAPNAARNTALCWARGKTVVGLDDCYELSPRYLWRTAALAAQGQYTAAVLRQVDSSVAYPPQDLGPVALGTPLGGICAYPLDVAVRLNGWDERFDATSGGDVDFTARLRLAGVAMVRDAEVAVLGHPHGARTASHPRCWHLSEELATRRRADGQLRANDPWTPAELQAWATCGRPDECSVTGFDCEYRGAEPLHDASIRVEYEGQPWFDLIAARAANDL